MHKPEASTFNTANAGVILWASKGASAAFVINRYKADRHSLHGRTMPVFIFKERGLL